MYHVSASNANPDALYVHSTVTPQSVIRTKPKPNPKLFQKSSYHRTTSLSLCVCHSLSLLQRQDNVPPILLITRLSHVRINRRTKRRKCSAASDNSLRPRILG